MKKLALIALLTTLSSGAFAHSSMETTTPENGSVLALAALALVASLLGLMLRGAALTDGADGMTDPECWVSYGIPLLAMRFCTDSQGGRNDARSSSLARGHCHVGAADRRPDGFDGHVV